MISAIALTGLLFGPNKPPAWLDTKLAGYVLVHDESHNVLCVYDKGTGYFLERGAECDGAIQWLVLTRDRNIPANEGYAIPGFVPKDRSAGTEKLILKALPSLSTGKGVKIGDTPSQLTRRLGKPTTIEKGGSRKQFTDYVFKWADGHGEMASHYVERYVFKAGKLIEIHFGVSNE
jgi:hypothetical protein